MRTDLFCHVSFPQARNKVGQVGYVPEKYLQFPTSNSLLSMLQSLAALDSRSHTSSNSTEAELVSGSLNGDASGKDCSWALVVGLVGPKPHLLPGVTARRLKASTLSLSCNIFLYVVPLVLYSRTLKPSFSD